MYRYHICIYITNKPPHHPKKKQKSEHGLGIFPTCPQSLNISIPPQKKTRLTSHPKFAVKSLKPQKTVAKMRLAPLALMVDLLFIATWGGGDYYKEWQVSH